MSALLDSIATEIVDCEHRTAPLGDGYVSSLPTSPPTQSFAAGALGAIDDLVENNRRRVKVLEEMARAIYREWFVHFRYPGHEDAALVDSPLGPIPEGWEVNPLFDVAEVSFGFSFKSARFSSSSSGPRRPVPRSQPRRASSWWPVA